MVNRYTIEYQLNLEIGEFMKKWEIRYWAGSKTKSPVEKLLLSLPKGQFNSVSKEIKLLEKIGNDLRLPHSKSLGDGLFELRERRYGYRIYYGFRDKQLIILVAAGDKTSQSRDIKIARERLLDV